MQTRQYQILSSGLFSLIILSFFLGSTYKTYSQTSGVPITSSTTWTVPTGVTSVNIECWGAGGSGGSSANNAGAGGGGGGAYSRSLNIVVVPGNDYTINVGIGGLAPGKNASGNVGGDTWFLSSSTVFAQGGSGGVSAGSGGAGGLGGDAANGIGNDVKFSGGVGADGTTVGGGGGYGAGNVTGGTPASGATGGIAPTGGGNGGDGGNNSDGTVGSPPGGAGGGAYGRNNLGAAGANGQVILIFSAGPECPTSTDIDPSTLQTVCEDVATNQLTATINGAGAYTPLYQWYYNTDTNTNDPNDPNANLIAGATSASYTPLSTASEIGTRYYFCVGYATDNGCTQTNDDQTLASTPVIITVNAIPSAPTGTAAQSFCAIDSPTVASLSATGTSIQWYDAPSGGSLLAGSTSLVNGNHYYATQTISSCESDTRFDVTVTVSDPPTTADAGPDQNISVDTATLAGNTPTSGTGMWNLISGSGTPTSPTSPTSGVTGLSNGANVFRWTISNVPCTDSWSEVTITTSFTASNPPTITLGTIPTICSGTTSVGLPYSATTNSPDKYSINFYDVTFTDVTNADLPVSPIAIDVPPSTPAGTYNAILTVTNTTTLLSSANYVIKITVIDIPSTPIISGETNVPENSDGFKYSTANVPNVTYNWDVPTGWNITDGDTTNRITVTTGALGQGGDITVTVTNICDTSQGSLTVTVSDATDHTLYNCTSCHITHNAPGSSLTAVFGNALLCQSCHTSTGAASAKPMIEAYNGTRSHAWDALAINPSKEVLLPDDSQMKLRVVDSRIICSTCHDQHNSSAGTPHLRVDNTGDALCKDCHRERDLGLYSTDNVNNRSSHPVGITYDGADSRFNASPTNTLLKAGKVECSSCHGVHDDKDATLGLEANGNLLRTTNDANLCKDCHSYGDHMGMNCLDCHQVHNAANQYNNIYLIKDSILTLEPILRPVQFLAETGANSFVDGDGNGVCEVCHDPLNGNPDRFLNDGTGVYHSGDEGPTDPKIGVNCTSCHPHSTNFTPIACHSCHETPDAYPTSGAHAKHAGSPYYFDCMTCHFGFGNNNESSHPEGVTPADVAFDPNGMATRNGQDANTPIWNSGAKTCDNVYCHSDGVSAEGTAEGSTVFGGVWEIAGTVPRTPPALPNFVTTPAWDSGTITCGECHLASANPTVSTTDWPQTGQHTGKGAHLVACWWCHNTDGTQTYMGTYGTTEHINGNVLFIPELVSNLGTFLNLPVPGGGDGNTASSGHCGSIAGGGKTCWY